MDPLDLLRSIPSKLSSKLDKGMNLTFFFFGLFMCGLYFAHVWQLSHGVDAVSLLESPDYLRLMILGGLYGFLASITVTFFVLPLWYDGTHQS